MRYEYKAHAKSHVRFEHVRYEYGPCIKKHARYEYGPCTKKHARYEYEPPTTRVTSTSLARLAQASHASHPRAL